MCGGDSHEWNTILSSGERGHGVAPSHWTMGSMVMVGECHTLWCVAWWWCWWRNVVPGGRGDAGDGSGRTTWWWWTCWTVGVTLGAGERGGVDIMSSVILSDGEHGGGDGRFHVSYWWLGTVW